MLDVDIRTIPVDRWPCPGEEIVLMVKKHCGISREEAFEYVRALVESKELVGWGCGYLAPKGNRRAELIFGLGDPPDENEIAGKVLNEYRDVPELV